MPGQTPQPGRPPQPRGSGRGVGLLAVWGALALTVLLPTAVIARRAITTRSSLGLDSFAIDPGPLFGSALFAGLIALLGLVLAWPVAMILARARPVWLLVAATPMLLPSYLAFAGWSIARAPTTPIGRFIGSAPDRGLEWLPRAAAQAVAVWGLALWVWPLAAVVVAVGLRGARSQIADPLSMERAGPVRRSLTLALAAWPSVLTAWLLAALLMLGSAVPLHVARVQTHAIAVWRTLDEHPGEPWRAWATAWPLVVLALAAGWLLSAKLARSGRRLTALADGRPESSRASVWSWALAAVPWVLAVIVPFWLFWTSMGGAGAVGRLFDRAGVGLATSAGVGAVVGSLAFVIALASAQAASVGRGRSPLRLALAAALAWALLPGVLVGSAVAHLFQLLPDAWAESVAPMIAAHLSRSLFLPILVGVWLGSAEAGGIAEARLLDGGTGPIAWARTSLRSAVGPALAVGLACACLSFHEIESSIQVQPPGIDHMAQRLLQWLHYERMAELSAAGVVLLGAGILASGVVILVSMLGRARTATRPGR